LLLAPAVGWAQCTGGCTTTTVGADTVHTFTANGTFTPPSGVTSVQYLVVGGGGGGGGITNVNAGGAGGGGAGGFRAVAGFAVTPGTPYAITVGAGGAGAACTTTCTAGSNGGSSIFSTITSVGGGTGAYLGDNNGASGGSGGGGRLNSAGTGGAGTGGQGNAGGDGAGAAFSAGGGGGASAAGATPGTAVGGAGGAGTASTITGASVTYAGGGGGGGYAAAGGAGGVGGGGSAPGVRGPGGNATANTGGGGGGATGDAGTTAHNGGNGGSGIVVVRYTTPLPARYAIASANWSLTTTWSATGCGGAGGAAVPVAGDDVTICATRTVAVNVATANLGSLTVQATGVLNGNNAITVAGATAVAGTVNATVNTGTKAFNGATTVSGGGVMTLGASTITFGGTLQTAGTVSCTSNTGTKTFNGAVTVQNGGVLDLQACTANVNNTTTVQNGGTVQFTTATGGTKTFAGNVTIDAGGTWTHSANSTATLAADLVNNGSFSTGTGAYTFSGDGLWGGSNPIAFGGNVTVSANVNRSNNNAAVSVTGNLALGNGATMTNNGAVSVTGNVTGGNASSTWTNAVNSTLNVTGTLMATGVLTASANGNTVNYNGAGNQTLKLPTGGNYFHLAGSTGGNKTPPGGTILVGGNLTVGAGATLNVTTNDPVITVTGNAVIDGTYTASNVAGSVLTIGGNLTLDGAYTGNTAPVNLAGDFTNNGTYTSGTGVFTFNGTAAQSLSGSAGTTTFTNLTLNNASGLTLSGTHNATVSTLLTLTAGRFTTGANVLFVANGSAIAGAGANTFVVGNLRKAYTTGIQTRVFEVGTEAGGVRYAPASITLGNVTVAGNVTVSSTAGDHPQIAGSSLNPSLSINRYWTLTNNSANFTAVAGNSISFNYVAADFDAGAAFANFYVGEYNAPTWTELTPSARTATTTTISGTGITTATIAGDYQIAERGSPLTVVAASLVCGTPNQVEVLFSRPVTAVTAQNVGNYALDGGATVASAVLDAGGQLVTLTTSALVAAQLYTLTVNNVAGVSGGTVPVNSQATFYTEGGYLSGLKGTYYDQGGVQRAYFTGATVIRLDGPLDFDWGNGIPVAGIGADDFSVVWEGFVTPPATGSYTFRTRSDDGVRLYFDGNPVPIIDNWTDHGPTNNDSAVFALTAGQRYAVRMEFYERGGGAVAQLLWSGPSTGGFQFIPRAQLSNFCGLPRPVAFYRMDEAAWSVAGAVADSSGNGLNGTAAGGALPSPAKVCNGAQLDGNTRYIEVAHDARLTMGASLTVAAWINTNSLTGALKTIVSKDENYEIHLDNTGQINWWWQNAGGTAETFTTTGTPITTGTWVHIAVVYAPGNQTIYINGAPRGTATFNNGLFANTKPLQIGADQYPGQPTRVFDGLIDEVRIYGQTLSQSDIALVIADSRPCAVFFNHVRIEHDGLALTCQPETVTVRACADALCASTYAGTVQTTLTPTGWGGGDTITFSGGSTTAQLRSSTAGIVTLGAGATSPLPVTAARCFNGGTETCSLDYRTSGFIFDVPDLTSCKPSAAVTITAVRADDTTQTCVPAFESGARSVNFWSTYADPATGSSAVAVNGTPVAGSSPGTGVSLTFTAGAVSSFTVTYPDAGQMQLRARYSGAGAESGLVMDGVDTFVAAPVGMAVVPSGGACAAGDATCAAYRKAGETFTHTVRAACWTSDADTDLSDNPVTPNFQMTGIPLSANLVAPAGGVNATLGATTVTLGSGDGGTKAVSQTVSEVGVFTITATPAAGGYFGLTLLPGTSPNIGRFTPDHYFLSGGATLGTRAAAACSPASSFTYMDEDFGLAFTLLARNAAGAVTQNYGTANGFAKLNPAAIAQLGLGARDGATPLTSRLDLGAGSAGTFATGSAMVTATLGVQRIASPDGPYSAVALGIAPTDSDGITITGVDFDGDATPGNERKSLGVTADVRFGRLRLQNAYGSGTVPLPVPIETQTWNGTTFVRNGDDDCTRIAAADIGLSDYKLNLDPGETTVVQSSIVFAGGLGTLTMTAPGAANAGSVLLTPDLATPGLSYLQGAWPGPTWDKNPAARVGFGLYGSQPRNFIFFRENY
jgi:MSHA biogenesis protein MshQ